MCASAANDNVREPLARAHASLIKCQSGAAAALLCARWLKRSQLFMRCETQEEHAGDESVLVLVSAAAAESPKLDARASARLLGRLEKGQHSSLKRSVSGKDARMRPKSGNPSQPVFGRLTLVMKLNFRSAT
jgi:hypothetical protein